MPSLRHAFNRVKNAPATWAAAGILLAALATCNGIQAMNAVTPEAQAREKVFTKKETGTPEEYRLAMRNLNDAGAAMALMLMAVGAGWMWERKRAQRALSPEFRQATEERAFVLQQQAVQDVHRQVEAAADAMHEGVEKKIKIGKALQLKLPASTNG